MTFMKINNNKLYTKKKNNLFRKPDKKTIVVLFSFLAILPIFLISMKIFGIIISYSGSIPIGFYRIVSNVDAIKRGDYISFCLPNKIAQMGMSRGYIKSGNCVNGSKELIKKVIALPGDKITVTDNMLRINNNTAYYAPTHILDKNKLPVHQFIKKGTRIARGYWVYGNNNSFYSWDSRYYGGISKINIRHKLIYIFHKNKITHLIPTKTREY